MPTPATTPASAAADRAAQRLATWAQRHPQAAALARLASLAVRVDASLLRRLRLQLLPRAEPGIEADLWFAGLHAAQGGGSLVLDAAVQQVLRTQLCQASAAPGQPRPLQAAWDITRGLHAAWPEALRIEEEVTFLALQGGASATTAIAQALQPALGAMASGGDARALEVARWAQRAMPRLPDAARQHPAVLALWLGALVRLGATGGPLPATGAAGLPPDLRWLLPAGTSAAAQRVACQPLADGLRLQPLPDGAADAAQQITLPAALAPLLAVVSHDGADQAQHQTVLLQGDTTVPLPPGWQLATLHNLAGQRWQLQRQAGGTGSGEPLAWQRAKVQVVGYRQVQGCFVSPTLVVTVADALSPEVRQALQQGRLPVPTGGPQLRLLTVDARGERQMLASRALALDLRTRLVLLQVQQPFADVVVPDRQTERPLMRLPVWIGVGQGAKATPWPGTVVEVDLAGGGTDHASAELTGLPPDGPPLDGAPVFVARQLLGVVDMPSAEKAPRRTGHLRMVTSVALERFLAWAGRTEPETTLLMLHGPESTQPDSLDAPAVQRIEAAARRAKLRLLRAGDDDGPGTGRYASGVAGAVQLVTAATTPKGATIPADDRAQWLALAARRWVRPDFRWLRLAHGRRGRQPDLPPLLAGSALLDLAALDDEQLARYLLDTAEPPQPLATPLRARLRLTEQLHRLAQPFMPAPQALAEVVRAAQAQDLAAVADFVGRQWNSSSRIDAVPLVEVLAQLALPVRDDSALAPLRHAARGAMVLNAMPAALGRLMIARAHAGSAPPPCVVVRDQSWQGTHSVDSIQQQVEAALAGSVGCSADEARHLLQRMDLAFWVLVTTRPLPDADTLLALEMRLPSARLLFLAGPQPDLADQARALRMTALPALDEGADMRWLSGFKRLMDWARPRKRATPQSTRMPPKARRK